MKSQKVMIELRLFQSNDDSRSALDMILGMYRGFAVKNNFKWSSNGVTKISIEGDCVYDLLKGESGVHGLTKLSLHLNQRRTVSHVQVLVNSETSTGELVRSYVLHPYKCAKDHTTQKTTNDVLAVLDGNIDLLFGEKISHGELFKPIGEYDSMPKTKLRKET